jgi:hypothetical protein
VLDLLLPKIVRRNSADFRQGLLLPNLDYYRHAGCAQDHGSVKCAEYSSKLDFQVSAQFDGSDGWDWDPMVPASENATIGDD